MSSTYTLPPLKIRALLSDEFIEFGAEVTLDEPDLKRWVSGMLACGPAGTQRDSLVLVLTLEEWKRFQTDPLLAAVRPARFAPSPAFGSFLAAARARNMDEIERLSQPRQELPQLPIELPEAAAYLGVRCVILRAGWELWRIRRSLRTGSLSSSEALEAWRKGLRELDQTPAETASPRGWRGDRRRVSWRQKR